MEDGRNAIPLDKSAPEESDEVWEKNPHIELVIKPKGPSHWLEHLDQELVKANQGEWPRSYEIQGDVLKANCTQGKLYVVHVGYQAKV